MYAIKLEAQSDAQHMLHVRLLPSPANHVVIANSCAQP